MSKSSGGGRGISVVGLLGVVFVTLKLCGVINWSWWWVTCPLWGGFAIVISIMAGIGMFAGVMAACEVIAKKYRGKNG